MMFLFKDYMQQETYLFITTNAPHRKRKWEKRCFEVFSQGLEEMHQELSKVGEDHKLGDVKTTPLDLHTLGLHTSNFCFSIETLYRINLERLFVCLGLIFILWDHHTIIYIWESYWKFGLIYVGCYYYIGKKDVGVDFKRYI